MSHVLYYIPQGELWQNNHFDFLVNVLDNSPQGNTLYDNMPIWASRSEMSQLRLAPFASCCTVCSREVCTNKMGFPHLTRQSKEARPNMEIYTKAWTEFLCPGIVLNISWGNDRQGNHSGCHLTTLVTFSACPVHIAPNELHKRIIQRKTLGWDDALPVCMRVCVCCICLPLLGSPTQTNHCFTIILHVLTRVCVCVCACVN